MFIRLRPILRQFVVHKTSGEDCAKLFFNEKQSRCLSLSLEDKKKDGLVHKEDWEWEIPQGHDTGMQLKNSYYCLRKQKHQGVVPFIVRDPTYVTWYACGPTVYDSSHIGHASTYLQFDLLRRALTTYFGLNICMVMGITNMDNKIINKALLYDRDFMEVADTNEKEFKRDMLNLNILPPTTYVRVTEIIPQIIYFIQDIIDKKQAYVNDKGDVYYSYNDAPQNVAKLYKEFFEGDITVTDKRFIKDISLWKSAKPGEPYWDSPWGKGRPGWHIECSVMASMCFGAKVDIHTGAADLMFPHHEYEVAQCDSFHGCHQWVNYFLHAGHTHVRGGEKMSKSLGNFITIEDCLQTYEPDFLRMLCCGQQWNTRYEFSDGVINRTQINLDTIRNFFLFCDEIMSGRKNVVVDTEAILEAMENCEKKRHNAMCRNFALRKAIEGIKGLITTVTESCKESPSHYSDVSTVVKSANYVENFLNNLGFNFHLPAFREGRRV